MFVYKNRIELINYPRYIKNRTILNVENVFEIGSKTGDDAIWLAEQFDLSHDKVYIFEPHEKLYSLIDNKFPQANTYQMAVYNKSSILSFNQANNLDDGRSSLLERDIYSTDFTSKKVQTIRMDDFMRLNNISKIDILKLDVEGAAFEVLEGFGEQIKNLNSVQIESEYNKVWKDQKTWEDIKLFMEDNQFKLLWDYDIIGIQNDSLWVRKELIK